MSFDQWLYTARMVASCGLLTCAALGAFGMRDSHQAKLPLTAMGMLIGWAGLKRIGVIQ